MKRVVDRILAFLGRRSGLKTYVDDRPGHDRRYPLDHTKIERELGWRPEVRFEVGLRETVDWYRNHLDWWSPKQTRLGRDLDEFAWTAASASEPMAERPH